MRIWSLHPKYLDTKGLLALWRETLLAKHVLRGQTKGYKNHPQLNRFKAAEKPLDAINQYLAGIYDEAQIRNFNFSKEKIDWSYEPVLLQVTQGQMDYEAQHLLKKLEVRDIERYNELKDIQKWRPHPLFSMVPGPIEDWEVLDKSGIPSSKRWNP